MPRLLVADPSLIVLIGPAGAGKSTFAARHFASDEVLSSDDYRERIAGDAADQRATRPAFARLGRELRRRLAAGSLTVVDATSLTRAARAGLRRAAAESRVPAIAIILDLPPAVVLARNRGRDRIVDPGIVADQLARLRALMDDGELWQEGFESAHWLRSPRAVDAVEVIRLRRRVRPEWNPS